MKEQLTIKGLKNWQTRDGGGYQFNLYRRGKKIAFVHEDGNGGPLQIDWFDKQSEQDIKAYAKTLPKIQMEDMDLALSVTVDIFLDDLVSEYEWEKKLNRHRKQGVLFRFLTDPEKSFRVIKTRNTEKAKEVLNRKYPNQFVLV